MAIVNRITAKTYFNTGNKPTEAQFGNFIDSAIFQEDISNFGKSLVSAETATSARTVLGAGTVGNALFQDTTQASAQNNIGGGTVGRQIFEATTTASAYNLISIPTATTSEKGINYVSKPVTLVNDGISITDTIGFNAGTFITSSGSQIYLPIIRKKIQSSGVWTAGDTNNGLDTGARASNTFYRTFVIQNNTTLVYDISFSLSATSPTIPSGYTNLGLMDYALIRTNTSNIIAISKWDANNKKLVLGSGQSIEVFNSTAGSGNVAIVSTTEPLEFVVRTYLTTTGLGGSDLAVYGSEHSSSDPLDTVLIATNNAFQVAGGGSVYTSDGKIYWKNFATTAGVGSQICKIKSIRIRS